MRARCCATTSRGSPRHEEGQESSPGLAIRHQAYEDEVHESGSVPPYLLVAGDCYDREIRVALREYGIPFGVVRAGGVNIIQPSTSIAPEQLLPVWARARGIEADGDVC